MVNAFPLLEKRGMAGISGKYKHDINRINGEGGLKEFMQFHGLKYKKDEKKHTLKFIERTKAKEEAALKAQLDRVSNAEIFKGGMVITVEWKRSRVWNKTATSHTNTGFKSPVVSGCGYCKTSTATAYALNSNDSVLKALYAKKEEALKKDDLPEHDNDIARKYLGYGSGYGVLPRFEGGVGVSAHQTICLNVGLEMKSIASTDWVDVFTVEVKKDK